MRFSWPKSAAPRPSLGRDRSTTNLIDSASATDVRPASTLASATSPSPLPRRTSQAAPASPNSANGSAEPPSRNTFSDGSR